jgi:hypothetical protein
VYDPSPELVAELELELQERAIYLLNAARSVGVPLIVISGVRSQERNREVGGATRSQHLLGRAVDVAVLGYRIDEIPTWWWSALGQYGEALGLRWGGRFNPPDLNHFDLGVRV